MNSFMSNLIEKSKLSAKQKQIASLAGDKDKIDAEDFEKLRNKNEDTSNLETVKEVLDKDSSASEWIHDFVHSDNPKFEGKSKKERMKMALAAYYDKQRNEELETIFNIGLDSFIIEALIKDENL